MSFLTRSAQTFQSEAFVLGNSLGRTHQNAGIGEATCRARRGDRSGNYKRTALRILLRRRTFIARQPCLQIALGALGQRPLPGRALFGAA